MGSKTAYLSQKINDHVLGKTIYTPPDNVWVVISADGFDPNATRASCDEIAASDYAPQELTNDATTWSAATLGAPSVKTNNNDIVWAAATSDWGTPNSVYLADAATGGNLLYGTDLIDPADIGVGDVFKILANTYNFNED